MFLICMGEWVEQSEREPFLFFLPLPTGSVTSVPFRGRKKENGMGAWGLSGSWGYGLMGGIIVVVFIIIVLGARS